MEIAKKASKPQFVPDGGRTFLINATAGVLMFACVAGPTSYVMSSGDSRPSRHYNVPGIHLNADPEKGPEPTRKSDKRGPIQYDAVPHQQLAYRHA